MLTSLFIGSYRLRTQRIVPAILLIASVSLSGCFSKTYLKEKDLRTFFRYSPQRKPVVSVHSSDGVYAGYPENCLESFAFVARQMQVLIEADISLTRDSTLIVLADDTYEIKTTGSGKVSELKWERARTFFLKDGKGKATPYRIPTVKDLLKWGKGKVILTLNVKKEVPLQRVVEAIQEMKAQRQAVLIARTPGQAALIHRLDAALMIQVSIYQPADYELYRKAGIPDERMVAYIGQKEASDELYSFLHDKGIMTILETAGSLDDMALARGDELYRKFFANGADILSTTRPLQAGRALGLIR